MKIEILGTRGIPANHGGFETFAEHYALYLVKKGWEVTVYCQEDGDGEVYHSTWNGVNRVHIPVKQTGAKGTIVFDWRATKISSSKPDLKLVLGYNTAIFNILFFIKRKTHLINMDGLEWKREKWNILEKTWLWLNERVGCWLGDELIADHPEIAKHLMTRASSKKITMIPYGSNKIDNADKEPLSDYGLTPFQYSIVIARPEPENSILEIIKAFSREKRNHKLMVLGNYTPDENAYHKEVLASASDEVIFPGAIYDQKIVGSLRFYSKLYIHGHTVGGTNPSLVEALGSGSAILAHDNRFNRWVAGDKAAYFKNEDDCAIQFSNLLDKDSLIESMQVSSRDRHAEAFTWDKILGEYETLAKKHYVN